VLWKPDGTVETAFRGELRDGDHAEFTLLERKNRATRLDDCVLFATLEPCAPDSRRPPKLGCAERIVSARIREVWVGIEDPDPTVDRKGIRYLEDSGVKVHMFDRDLQEVIRSENKDFISGALGRAEAAKTHTKKNVALSYLEGCAEECELKDLSKEALEHYRSTVAIGPEVGSDAFNRRLLQQGLLKRVGSSLVPTGFGILLFGEKPRPSFQQAGLMGTIKYSNGTQEVEDFDGPLVLIPEHVEKWLRNKLPNIVDRGTMQRSNVPALPFELVREAVVNALVHRDYDIKGSKCQLTVTAGAITIMSPGAPVPPITLTQMQNFDAPMLSRNPLLHYVFSQMGMAEERGFGLQSFRERAHEANLPLPKFSFWDPYLVLTLFQNVQMRADRLTELSTQDLNPDEREALKVILTKDSISSRELMQHLHFDERKAQRVLNKLVKAQLLQKTGNGPSTRYVMSERDEY
jgi:ATP-dependent DNA helicase RecG